VRAIILNIEAEKRVGGGFESQETFTKSQDFFLQIIETIDSRKSKEIPFALFSEICIPDFVILIEPKILQR